jgi:hypothetical protein
VNTRPPVSDRGMASPAPQISGRDKCPRRTKGRESDFLSDPSWAGQPVARGGPVYFATNGRGTSGGLWSAGIGQT